MMGSGTMVPGGIGPGSGLTVGPSQGMETAISGARRVRQGGGGNPGRGLDAGSCQVPGLGLELAGFSVTGSNGLCNPAAGAASAMGSPGGSGAGSTAGRVPGGLAGRSGGSDGGAAPAVGAAGDRAGSGSSSSSSSVGGGGGGGGGGGETRATVVADLGEGAAKFAAWYEAEEGHAPDPELVRRVLASV